MMRAVLYTEPFFPLIGGMERFAEDLAVGLDELGVDLTLVTMTDGGGDDPGRFRFPVIRATGFADKVTAFRQADVVLLSGLTIAGFAAALLARRPFLVVHHGAYRSPGSARAAVSSALKRRACRLTANVSVSRALARDLGGRHLVIGNPYQDDVYRELGHARQPASFIFCGRLVSEKGCDLAVRAIAAVRRQLPHATLTVVGSGPEHAALAALAIREGAGEAIKFAGSLPPSKLADAYRRHACAVIPSRCDETFGIVALEARACGCDLIVSKRGGLPEAAGPEARVVEPEPDALAAAMLDACRNPGLADRANVERHLRRHGRRYVARRYARILKAVRAMSR